jgi:double-strand break repair protein MRE11
MFNILICSDLHLGYCENDPIRKNDTFETFEEVLQIAKSRNVDFILCSGDFFHHNNPSRNTMNKTIHLLRKYCVFKKEHEYRTTKSDVYEHNISQISNVDDKALNIGLPIYTIHGNHDDLNCRGLTALDPLHEAGLINLIGKNVNNECYVMTPIQFEKQGCKLAVYGIGCQKDERLSASLKTGITWNIVEGHFNVLLLHQNRYPRGTMGYIDANLLPNYLNLVIWGHEHECQIEPQKINNLYITQPGSTVATSLNKSESGLKKVAILKITHTFELEPIILKSVRPFVWREVKNTQNIDSVVKQAIADAKLISDKEPLVRVRIKTNKPFDTVKASVKYSELANSQNMFLLKEHNFPKKEFQIDLNLPKNIQEGVEKFLKNESDALNVCVEKHISTLETKVKNEININNPIDITMVEKLLKN